MVLLEFKICPSCCSYFLSHTREREAILDSDTPMSPPMTIGQQGPVLQADTMQIPLGRSQVHLMDSETNLRTTALADKLLDESEKGPKLMGGVSAMLR